MQIQEAIAQLRAAFPDADLVQIQATVGDYNHTPGKPRACFEIWNGQHHFQSATLEQAVTLAIKNVPERLSGTSEVEEAFADVAEMAGKGEAA